MPVSAAVTLLPMTQSSGNQLPLSALAMKTTKYPCGRDRDSDGGSSLASTVGCSTLQSTFTHGTGVLVCSAPFRQSPTHSDAFNDVFHFCSELQTFLKRRSEVNLAWIPPVLGVVRRES